MAIIKFREKLYFWTLSILTFDHSTAAAIFLGLMTFAVLVGKI